MSDNKGTRPEYLIPTTIPRQQWLLERVTILTYMCIASIFLNSWKPADPDPNMQPYICSKQTA